jgi:predicted amidophosphoribosyltransferase
VLLPPVCPACGAVGAAPCRGCLAALEPAPLLPPPPGLEGCLALLSYDGAGRELVARLKYRSNRAVLGGLGRAMASLLPAGAPVALTWAPTTPARRRERGFDQAELLARAVARARGGRARPLLHRAPGPAQTGRSRLERSSAPAFEPIRTLRSAVVVIDDVVTSGATLTAAAGALRRAGASSVVGLCAARTPPPGAMHGKSCGSAAQAPRGR